MSNGKLYVLQVAPHPAIVELNEDGSEPRELLSPLSGLPDGLIVDRSRGLIFFTLMGMRMNETSESFPDADGSIQVCPLEGGSATLLFGYGTTVTPKQIAADLAAGQLYWCDREGMRIFRGRIDGTEQQVLLQTGIFPRDIGNADLHCVGIALDTQSSHMYWTQKGPPDGGRGRIFRASLEIPKGETPDRRSDIELLLDNLPEPIDLAIDEQRRLLYWTDRGVGPCGNSLNRAKITNVGLSDYQVLATGLQEGIGLARDERTGRIFISDLSGHIYVASEESNYEELVQLAKLSALTGIEYVP